MFDWIAVGPDLLFHQRMSLIQDLVVFIFSFLLTSILALATFKRFHPDLDAWAKTKGFPDFAELSDVFITLVFGVSMLFISFVVLGYLLTNFAEVKTDVRAAFLLAMDKECGAINGTTQCVLISELLGGGSWRGFGNNTTALWNYTPYKPMDNLTEVFVNRSDE